jgi:hypothetical protein
MGVPVSAAARIAACCITTLALIGCAAGQISQTSREFPAVDGTSGNVGNSIALRDVLIPYPHNQAASYPVGSAVPVILSIVNQGDRVDELVGVTVPQPARCW